MAFALTDIDLYNKRLAAMHTERSSWMSQWQSVSRFVQPVSGRFFVTDRNKGQDRFNDIYDNTGTRALRILAAGMMSGMTSPSRPWFRLALDNRDLMKYQPVKLWLDIATEVMLSIFARSNFYRVFHSMYEELGAFGTSAAMLVDDFQTVTHVHQFPIGEYLISTDWKGNVTSLYREFDRTVGQIVKEFGRLAASPTVRNAYDNGNIETWVTLVHCIEPREDRDITKRDNKNMPWKSVYYEKSQHNGKVLRESGYKQFPCICPRWMALGGDIYGVSPAMETLGDIRQLQTEQYRKMQAIDLKANPPVQVPTSMKNREVNLFPGGITYYDAAATTQGIKNTFEIPIDIRELQLDLQDTRNRINATFYTDLFLMISQQDAGGRMTATEVVERHEEKMLMLGPVIERLSNEQLDPAVEITFQRALTGGLLPPAPQELQGQMLNIEYISMMAQAQKAISLNSIDRFVLGLGQIATIKPDVLDKFNADEWVNVYSDKMGVSPDLIVGNEQVVLIRKQRAAQMEAAQKMAAMQQMAETASTAGNIPTAPGTAAGDLIKSLQATRMH